MDEINAFIEKYNKPLSLEEIKKVIYNVFAIIIFLMPIVPEIVGMGIYSLKNTILNLATFSTSIVLLIIKLRQRDFKINIYDILLVIYMVLVAISCFTSEFGLLKNILGTNGRGEGLITIASYSITFVIFCHGYRYLKKTIKIALIGAIGVSIYAFLQANFNIDYDLLYDVKGDGIATGTMRNQNFLSSYICLFLPMMCYCYLNKKREKIIVLVIILFSTLVYSKTLGGYLTFGAMTFIIIIISFVCTNNKKQLLLKTLKLILALILTFGCITVISGDVYLKEVKTSQKEISNLTNKSVKFGTNRMIIWRQTLKVINDNKLLGVGLDSLKYDIDKPEYIDKASEEYLSKRIVDKAHSEILHIAATTGIPSAVIYITIVSIVILRLLNILIRRRKEYKLDEKQTHNIIYITMITISILSYFIQSIGNISVVQVAPIYWAILGLGAGITLEEKNKN